MKTTKRKAWARTTLDLAIPPKDPSAIAKWRAETLAEIEKQRPMAIPGHVCVSCMTGIGDHDPLVVANEITSLLREAGVVTSGNIVTVSAGMDRLVPSGRVEVTCWRTTPPAARIGADVRRHHAERQTAMFKALRALRSTAGAAA